MTPIILHPRQITAQKAAQRLIGETARAFATNPQIHPSRAPYEFYPTPPEATRALLSVESFDGSIWEPACGEGHISKVLEAHGHQVVSTDLVDHGYGEPSHDFLTERESRAKHVLTNPPYGRGLGDAFCRHALNLTRQTGGKVAMLVAIQSLCHPIRTPFFLETKPKVIYALDECHCYPEGDPKRATRSLMSQRYCWIVWEHGHTGPTRFDWLTTAPFRQTRTSTQLLLH